MKYLVFVLCCLFLSGCEKNDDALVELLSFREQIQSQSFRFDANITADYGDELHNFCMLCEFNKEGDMNFTVLEPESISMITGSISNHGAQLTFDDKILAFEMLADGQITPVTAPWILIKTLKSGYINSYGEIGNEMLVKIDDSYESEPFYTDISFSEANMPKRGEIIWQGRRILCVEIENFAFL